MGVQRGWESERNRVRNKNHRKLLTSDRTRWRQNEVYSRPDYRLTELWRVNIYTKCWNIQSNLTARLWEKIEKKKQQQPDSCVWSRDRVEQRMEVLWLLAPTKWRGSQNESMFMVKALLTRSLLFFAGIIARCCRRRPPRERTRRRRCDLRFFQTRNSRSGIIHTATVSTGCRRISPKPRDVSQLSATVMQ